MKSGILPCLDWAIMTATSVEARGDCDIPIDDWRTREAARAMAEDQCWKLKRIKIDDGCHEMYGTDRDGALRQKLIPRWSKISRQETSQPSLTFPQIPINILNGR